MRTIWIGLVLSGLLACQGSSGEDPPHRSTDAGPVTADGLLAVTCEPACLAPQRCSAIGVCLDPGSCAHELDCDPGEACDPVKRTCLPKDQCGAQELQTNLVAPNLLIVLDRSCSMTNLVGGTSKFDIAVAAIDNLLTRNEGRIRFGLILFPDIAGAKCAQDGAVAVPLGSGNESKIKTLLAAARKKADPLFPDGPCVTNIDTAIEQAAAQPGLKEPGRESFVLLITDGNQAGCALAGGDAGTTAIISGLRQAKISTYVVGFGGAVDPKQLSLFADAGGKPSGDPVHRFYKAEDQVSLDAALASISRQSFGCVFKLQQPPPDLQKIYVFFDGKEVPEDKTQQSGWDYDPATSQVTFHGAACKLLEENKVSDLDIVYGCQKPVDPEKPGDPACPGGASICEKNEDCGAGYACTSRCCSKVLD